MNELDEHFAMQDRKEEKILNKQMDSGLRMLARWETMFKEECPRLSKYTIEVKIPYLRHWIKKYKWVAPSIPRLLQERWEAYRSFKLSGDTKDLNSLF